MPKSVPAFFMPFSSALNQGMPAILTTVTIFFWSCAKERPEIPTRMAAATAAAPKSFNVSRLFTPLKMHDPGGKPINLRQGHCHLPGHWLRSKNRRDAPFYRKNTTGVARSREQPLARWTMVSSKTYVTKVYRIRSFLSVTLRISRAGEKGEPGADINTGSPRRQWPRQVT